MTDPTAKGYTASWEHRSYVPAAQPTVEEMKAEVLAAYPTAAIFPWDDRLDILGIGNGDGTSIIHLSDPVYATDDIWKSAYSQLPAKAAPEPALTLEDTKKAVLAHDKDAFCVASLGSFTIVTYNGYSLSDRQSTREDAWMDAYKLIPQRASKTDLERAKEKAESEDEAFERWWNSPEGGNGFRHAMYPEVARKAWNARARMSAGTSGSVDVERALYDCLIALRSLLWSEGYADQTPAMAKACAAIKLYEAKGTK